LSSKKAKVKFQPLSIKKPRTDPNNEPSRVLKKKPSWRFSIVDVEGEWGWGKIRDVKTLIDIKDKLKHIENNTWEEIGKNGSHFVEVQKLCKKARNRLRELSLDDYDQLYSLRLSAKERIWGTIEQEVFYVLWWDPEHSVCHAEKKHT